MELGEAGRTDSNECRCASGFAGRWSVVWSRGICDGYCGLLYQRASDERWRAVE